MMDRLQESFQRLRSIFRRSQLDHELDEELAAHLEMAIEEDLQRGIPREEARRRALIRLGGVEQVRQQHWEARALPRIETFFQDFRYAARGILKSPGFTSAAVLTLALGIAVNATLFGMVSGFLLRPPSARDPERVVVISSVNPAGGRWSDVNLVSAPNYLAWRGGNHVFESMAAADEFRSASLNWQGQTQALHSAAVTAGYFSVLGVTPQLGRDFYGEEDRTGRNHVVILSHEVWEREFGADPSIVGRVIRLDREDSTVVGVMPANFHLMGLTPQVWTPLVLSTADQSAIAHKDRSLFVIARLKRGVTLAQARAELSTLARLSQQDFPDTEKGWGAAARTLPDFLVYRFGIRTALIVAMTVVGFVLLIACANVAGLLLARASSRWKELAIRMSLGASRLRVVRQLLTEGLTVALLGGSLGLMLAYWGIQVVRANIGSNEVIRRVQLSLDWNVLVFTTIVSLFSAVLCSLAPALAASRTDINSNLKDESRAASAGRSQGRLRTVLVTAEIAAALFLLIGTGLLLRGILLVEQQDLGFQAERLLTGAVALDHARYKGSGEQSLFVQTLLPRLRQIPGADAVAIVSDLPAAFSSRIGLRIKGQPELPASQLPRALDVVATTDYFRTAGIPLLRGRKFTDRDDTSSPRVVIVNEEFVRRYLKNQEPLGKQIRLDVRGGTADWSEIVGVVANIKTFSEADHFDPQVYESFLQRPVPSFFLILRTGADPNSLTSDLRKAVAQTDRELPLAELRSMSSVIENQKGSTDFFLRMLATFGILALGLAGIGIYGLIAYSVGQRTHEIAIRMALGAAAREIRMMVLRQGLKMAGVGAAIGLVLSLPLPKLFAAIFDDLHTGNLQIYLIVPAAIFLVAMLATYIPAHRASRIDPMMALHSN